MKPKSIRYSVRDVPEQIDREIRARAARERTSVNQVVINALRDSVSGGAAPKKRIDLSWFIGKDPIPEEFDKLVESMRQIEPEDWK